MTLIPSPGCSSGKAHRVSHISRVSKVLAILAFAFPGVLIVDLGAQGNPPKPTAAQTPKPIPKPGPPAAASRVHTVIELLKAGAQESLIINTLKNENKPQTVSPADLLKLMQAGATENIINALMYPAGATGSASGAARPSASTETGAATAFPPDLPDVAARKRRLAVRSFDYSTVTNYVNFWFNNNTNIGEGIRSMLTVRLSGSPQLTMLERTALEDVMKEQDIGASNRVRKGTNARVGQLSGADVMLYGDIVIFGRDDTTKRKGLGALIGAVSPIGGAIATMNKSEKAVVGINLRLVDTETGEVIETAEARGESSRTSKDYAGLLGGKGAAVGAASSMTSSNFQQTIIGEATSNAVTNIVKYLESRVPQLPPKPRSIEGRVAAVNDSTATLTVGSEHGVLRGDRFEILKINGEIRDPVTKDVIDIDAVKVGELVVDSPRDKVATGAYGGQSLSATYATSDKGYAARLISK